MNDDDDHPQYLDAGYIFSPYIPAVQTPVVLDPDAFETRRGILTRYGRRLLEEGGRYYTIGDFRFRHMKESPAKVNWLKEGF